MNVDAIANIIREANADGTIDDALSTAMTTLERRQRFLYACFLIDAVLRWCERRNPSVQGG